MAGSGTAAAINWPVPCCNCWRCCRAARAPAALEESHVQGRAGRAIAIPDIDALPGPEREGAPGEVVDVTRAAGPEVGPREQELLGPGAIQEQARGPGAPGRVLQTVVHEIAADEPLIPRPAHEISVSTDGEVREVVIGRVADIARLSGFAQRKMSCRMSFRPRRPAMGLGT